MNARSGLRIFTVWCSVEALPCDLQGPCAWSWSKLKLPTRGSRHRVISWSLFRGIVCALWSLLYTNDLNQFSLVICEHLTYQTGWNI